jgi:hypothetical protein
MLLSLESSPGTVQAKELLLRLQPFVHACPFVREAFGYVFFAARQVNIPITG